MHILGIDPGLQATGYGVLAVEQGRARFLEAGAIRTQGEAEDLPDKLKLLAEGIGEILDEYRPAAVAMEQLYAHYEHPRTAILMGHARGVLMLAAVQRGIPVVSYASTKVKKLITGNGRAGKEQVQQAVTRELGLSQPPEPFDAADALALALCHASAAAPLHGSRNATYTGVNLKALLGDKDDSA